jgi:hypothetical protein
MICSKYQQQRSRDSPYALKGEEERNQLIKRIRILEQCIQRNESKINLDDQSRSESSAQVYSNSLQTSYTHSFGVLDLDQMNSARYHQSASDEANSYEWPLAHVLPSMSAPLESSRYIFSSLEINSVLVSPDIVKRRQIVQLLMKELESTSEFSEIFKQGSHRWYGTMKRARGPGPTSNNLCLKDFAQCALMERNVFEIAKLAQIVADISDPSTSNRLMHIVNHLIVTDDDLLMTTEGLQCAFFQSMLYVDTGQPQYAWYAS